MLLFVYATRDKLVAAFDMPVFRREDVEHTKEMTIRGLKYSKPESIVELRDKALYYLGQFDDLKGKFILLDEPEKMLDYEDYLPRKVLNDGTGQCKEK